MALAKRKRPIGKEEDVNAENLEEIFRDYDNKMQLIDARRIAQQTTVSDSATLADLITAVNTLIAALNGSELTDES